ncbi:hypothetical protein BDV23DRAFT_188548 [Aspergillus alliaceus]|uniref:Uncharacterized protein n=1 Tax=Petromyces alliaceus TaxID=209559 RepID=A0A5N7BTG4_PETAA|nr:hypothetical protein BDV23DRAFT_188548 [Aspergillus alliaceus]
MPLTDQHCIVVNCTNGVVRTRRSWVIGGMLRDYEDSHKVGLDGSITGPDSIWIDISELEEYLKPAIDNMWWYGWLVMIVQVEIAVVPVGNTRQLGSNDGGTLWQRADSALLLSTTVQR